MIRREGNLLGCESLPIARSKRILFALSLSGKVYPPVSADPESRRTFHLSLRRAFRNTFQGPAGESPNASGPCCRAGNCRRPTAITQEATDDFSEID